MASPNTSQGDVRSNPPTHLADFSDGQANAAVHQKTAQQQNSASGLIRCIARKPQWCRRQPPWLKLVFLESRARGLMPSMISVRIQAHSNISCYLICSVRLSFVMLSQNRVFSTKTAGVPQSNGTTLSHGRNAREAQELKKLSINATEFLQYVIQPCHETSPDSILQAPSNA